MILKIYKLNLQNYLGQYACCRIIGNKRPGLSRCTAACFSPYCKNKQPYIKLHNKF